MQLNTSYLSPNFGPNEIPVDFLVIHYTACDLQTTMNIFMDRDKKVCAHFVVDTDGTIYDLGGFINGPIRLGAHAGKSHLEVNGTRYEAFNQFSIGIEIINFNGNLIEYTDAQYEALTELVGHLQTRFPQLKNPERIVGHEHIAHWRGKADPGVLFDWKRFLNSLGMEPTKLHSFFACNKKDLAWLSEQKNIEDWARLSLDLETRIAQKGV